MKTVEISEEDKHSDTVTLLCAVTQKFPTVLNQIKLQL